MLQFLFGNTFKGKKAKKQFPEITGFRGSTHVLFFLFSFHVTVIDQSLTTVGAKI